VRQQLSHPGWQSKPSFTACHLLLLISRFSKKGISLWQRYWQRAPQRTRRSKRVPCIVSEILRLKSINILNCISKKFVKLLRQLQKAKILE
jgi:hypothetical protein